MDELRISFDPLHTLGFLVSDWIEAHVLVPGGVFEGEPLVLRGWQILTTVNHYRVTPDAVVDPRRLMAPFHFRRSVIVGPQKSGKSPMGAAWSLVESVGPALFAGFARGGEQYRCVDHGCGCGFVYDYLPGEAMGTGRRRVLWGLLASAESQAMNVYDPLQTMVRNGPLSELVMVREGFMRLPNGGKVQTMTAKATSKLGEPYTGALADESGLYTAQNKVLNTWQTIRRAVAAMQGRTIELTNPWDPMENSAAQQAFESRRPDIYRYYRKPPADLSYGNRRDRRKIHDYVYSDSPWVDARGIDAEAAELVETDPTQAERFFGNRLVQGLGSFLSESLLDDAEASIAAPDGSMVAAGFDGSRSGDWTALRLETIAGHRFTPTYGVDSRPTFWRPEEWPDGRIPRGEVDAAVDEIFRRWNVTRLYVDPRYWETQADDWASRFGEDRVVQWPTNSISRMFPALLRYREDMAGGLTTHEPDEGFRAHALAARKVSKPGDKYILGKPAEHMKIDILMADVLAHEAAADSRAAGWSDGPVQVVSF